MKYLFFFVLFCSTQIFSMEDNFVPSYEYNYDLSQPGKKHIILSWHLSSATQASDPASSQTEKNYIQKLSPESKRRKRELLAELLIKVAKKN